MPSKTDAETHAIAELDAFFEHHAVTLTPERIAIELERIPNRYALENNDILLEHLRTKLQETTPETHPQLHTHANSYLRLKSLEAHGNAEDIFDLSD